MHFNVFNNIMKYIPHSQDGNWALQLPLCYLFYCCYYFWLTRCLHHSGEDWSHSRQEADLSNFMTFVFFTYILHKNEQKTTTSIKTLYDYIH